MHPAPSIIVFSVLSGAGFGGLFFLASGLAVYTGPEALFRWGLAYALCASGLFASAFHLGRPDRAWRAFSQWRTSWLSREAWAAALTLGLLALPALMAILGQGFWGAPLRILGALGALATVLCTAMIYAQLKTVPRWHHWTTPATFLAFATAGGALLTDNGRVALAGLVAITVLVAVAKVRGQRAFADSGASLHSALGLGASDSARVFAPAHTGGSYVMREMIHQVGRRHAAKLRLIGIVLAMVLPAIIAVANMAWLSVAIALPLHLTGAFALRWLFFAEAEHVVGLYYGRA